MFMEEKKICKCEGKMCSDLCGDCHHFLGNIYDDYAKCYYWGNYKHPTDDACDKFMPK